MESRRFDSLTRGFALAAPRRAIAKAIFAGVAGTLTGVMTGHFAVRPTRAAAGSGCCKCQGSNRNCQDAPSQAECDSYCSNSGKPGIFSENHTCEPGKSGGNICKRKTGTALEEACPPRTTCTPATSTAVLRAFQSTEEDDACCGEVAYLTSSAATVAAHDVAARSADGWLTRVTEACFNGDACRAGGLFGIVPGDEIERLAAGVVDGYRHKSARGAETAVQAVSVMVDNLFLSFDSARAAEEFGERFRGMAPDGVLDFNDLLSFGTLDFVFGVEGPTDEVQDPAAVLLTAFLRQGERAILSRSTSVRGVGFPYTEEEYQEIVRSFTGAPVQLDLELLVRAMPTIAYGPQVNPAASFGATVIDGVSLARDGETAESAAFRMLTDAGTISAVRNSQVIATAASPTNVITELREFDTADDASAFIAGSLERVQNYFGSGLYTFVVTEFDQLGDQGTGFIYMLNLDNGGVLGGVTGYSRYGAIVGVANVNIRTDGPASAEQISSIYDGRFYAEPGVRLLELFLDQMASGSPETNPDPVGVEWFFR
jgi:hypothetical protein